MKKYKIALVIESIVVFLMAMVVAVGFFFGSINNKTTEKYRESSPDGKYVLIVNEIGEPIWPFGPMKYEVRLFPTDMKSNGSTASFETWVSDDGGRGSFTVKWENNQAVIIFDGEEQNEAVFALPIK